MKARINILILLACVLLPFAAKGDDAQNKINLQCVNLKSGENRYYFNNAVFRAEGEWAVDNTKEVVTRTRMSGSSASDTPYSYFSFFEDNCTYIVVSEAGNKRVFTGWSFQVILPKGLLYDPANPQNVSPQTGITINGSGTKPGTISEEDKVKMEVYLNGHTFTTPHLAGLTCRLTVNPATFFKTSSAKFNGASILSSMSGKTFTDVINADSRFEFETREFTGIKTEPDATGLGSYKKCAATVESAPGRLIFRNMTVGQTVSVLDSAGELLATHTAQTSVSPDSADGGMVTISLPAGYYLCAIGTEHIPMTVE